MERDRRESERVWVNVTARWQGLLNAREGSISDISKTGCFLLTGGEVSPGELVSIEINLPQLPRLRLWGKVVYHVPEMGFALRFTDMNITDETLLSRLIEYGHSGTIGISESEPPRNQSE
jgi:hypothetical protein